MIQLKKIFELVKKLLKKISSADDDDDGRTEHTGRTCPIVPVTQQQDIEQAPWEGIWDEVGWIVDLDEKLESLSRLDTDEQELGDNLTNDDLDR